MLKDYKNFHRELNLFTKQLNKSIYSLKGVMGGWFECRHYATYGHTRKNAADDVLGTLCNRFKNI